MVDNSAGAMADSAAKRLIVGTRPANDSVENAVADTGQGIQEDVLTMLFSEPIEPPKGSDLAGIGLLMAQTIVQTCGGEISVDTTGPSGTTMVMRFPVESGVE